MQPMTIVGVVGDVRQGSPATPPSQTLYFPLEQHPYHANELQVIVRTTGAPGALTEAVRSVAHQLNPAMAMKFTTLDDMVAESVSAPRFRSFVAGTFGGLALLLAMAGIYGVMSFMVSQRTAELGLRMALGAMGSDVVRLVLRKAGVLAAAGLVLGTTLSLASSRLMGSLLFGLTATDTSTYLIAFAGVGLIAGLAATGPAWRASRIDPMVALRED
jgi:ABC-type antimicrobial peptide transport system permease subunit